MSFVKKSIIIVISVATLITVSQFLSKTDNQALYARSQQDARTEAVQPDSQVFVPDYMKHYKEKYEAKYENAPFEIVWTSVKEVLDEMKCYYQTPSYRVDTSGYYIGSITTEDWIFAEGEDSTYDLIKRYSLDVPQIPGAIWSTGRLNFKFRVQQISDKAILITLRTKMSGKENSATQQVHFWKSNGLLEEEVLAKIEAKMQAYFKENSN